MQFHTKLHGPYNTQLRMFTLTNTIPFACAATNSALPQTFSRRFSSVTKEASQKPALYQRSIKYTTERGVCGLQLDVCIHTVTALPVLRFTQSVGTFVNESSKLASRECWNQKALFPEMFGKRGRTLF
jgi:hypothetical protein